MVRDVLASQAGKLVREAVHQVDEPDGKQERPRYLNQPKTEVYGCPNKIYKHVINRLGR